MSNKHQQLKLHQSFIFNPKHYRLFALGLFAFLCAYVVASTLTPVRESDASTVEITNNTTDYFIRITSADNLPMSVEAKPTGQLAYAADTVNIVTNSDNGYKLYVSTSGNDNNIYQNGSSSTASEGYFQPSTGTVTSPVALIQNSWGFALNKTQSTSISTAFANASEYVNETGAPTTSSTWAGVPTYANSDQAKISESSEANAPDGYNLDIYYGVDASTTLPDGNYSTEVTYTAISEGVNVFPTMQDFTAEQCYNMATNTSINLSDSRDDKYYRVTKMADGHCWMTDNLALDGTDAAGNVRVLTPSDSNVTQNRSLAANIENGTTSVDTAIQVYSGNADDYTDATEAASYPYAVANNTKYGNLYNFMAATAGVGTASATGTITESVCPKGWQLPDNTGAYSFYALMVAYGLPNTENTTDSNATQTIQQSPLNFPLSGTYADQPVQQGLSASYWARTIWPAGSSSGYYLYFNSQYGYFRPQSGAYKRFSLPVRCVFSGQSTDPTMQDFTTTMCNNLAVNSSKVLVDRRNREFYRVVHAQDGNCWMADNLSIYGQDISATDSDFTTPSTYTIPAGITQTSEWSTNFYDRPMIEVSHGLGANASSDPKYYGEVYYNWCAATATSGNSSVNCNTTTAPNTSICPAGWQLPVNGPETTNKSWAKLLGSTYGYNITSGTALLENQYLGFTGYYGYWSWRYLSENSQGGGGYFWSGTPVSDQGNISRAYYFEYNGPAITPQAIDYKGLGHSIRCVQR